MSEVINTKEKVLVEYALADRVTLSKCIRILKPSYFDKPLDRVVDFVVKYFHEYHSSPNVDVIEAETGIELKQRSVEPHEIEYLLKEIEDHCKDAAMVEAVLKAADMIEGDAKKGIPDLMREALLVQIDDSIGTSLFDDPETRISTMDQAVDERPIGIPKFDEMIGNIRRGELGIVYAVSSGGKSVFLGNAASLLAKQGLDVSIISMELNENLYSKRLDTVLTGFDITHHADYSSDIANALTSLKGTMGDITTKKLRARSTVSDIRSYLTEYHLAKGKYPDVLLVDYLAMMGSNNPNIKGSGVHEVQEDIAIALRDLVDEFDMYGITAGQVNREGQGIIDVGPQHCSGSIAVINTVDWAVSLTASEEDIDNNQVSCGQLKIRNSTKTSERIILYRCPKTLRMNDQPFTGKNMVTPVKTAKKQQAKPKQNQQTKEAQKALTTSTGKDKLNAAMKLTKRG